MSDVIPERRVLDRTKVVFPVELTSDSNIGETIEISETGISMKFKKNGLVPVESILLKVTTPTFLKLKIQNVWSRVVEDGACFGGQFLDITEEDRNILREGLLRYKFIDPLFVNLTLEIRHFLMKIKTEFDEFDKTGPDESQQIRFISENKKEIFSKLDKDFNVVWQAAKDLDTKSSNIYKRYFHQMLEPFLGCQMEINNHIYQKPLGYPGDFMVMNYIFDYHKDKYLGETSYQKLINHYTCNIPIAKSNVRRKEFFKYKILEILKEKKNPRLLSVCSGPVKELIELVEEGKIDRPLTFKCIDFEERTLWYIMDEMKKIDDNKKQFLKIEYLHKSIPTLIRNKTLKGEVGKQDLVYSSGLFDYLTNRLASRLVRDLYELLDKKGLLIMCNASLIDNSHRAYYELLGDWVFNHRTKEELLEWTKTLKTTGEIKIDGPQDGRCYLYLHVNKG